MKLYSQYFPEGEAADDFKRKTPVVILPGLFGSTVNWRSFARNLSKNCPVIVVDHRNHGKSPHADTHSYADLVQDLLEFLEQQDLSQVILCGHSMGGKAAMIFSLLHPEKVEKLLVLDIAPVTYGHSHMPFIDALLELDLSTLQSRSEADKQLKSAIPDTGTRLFLLQSLVGSPGEFSWRINLVVLKEYLDQIGGFPSELVLDMQSSMPTMAIYGASSDYLQDKDRPLIRQYFPQVEFDEIDKAGHWLHVEQPQAVLDSVKDFIFDG